MSRGSGGERPPRRKRVVLAHRRHTRPMARTIMELEEQTSVGEVLVRNLVKAQLRDALLLAGVAMLAIAGLPALFWFFPQVGRTLLLGVPLPWLLLGAVPYPVLVLIGYLSTRLARRHERDFLHMVER